MHLDGRRTPVRRMIQIGLGLLIVMATAAISDGLAPNTPAAQAGMPLAITPRVYLPIVLKPGLQVNPAGLFVGANGGPIDGIDCACDFDGDLAYNSILRAKSFDWMTTSGIRWYRNYSSDGITYSWRFVEPQANVFDWTAWDLLVQQAQLHDVALLASIGNAVPQWSNGSTSFRDKPLDLYANPMQSTSWYNYVYTFVERYDGDGLNDMPGLTRPIKYWEFWNEPDLREGWIPPDYLPHQFNGDVNDYVRLSYVGWSAVKAADPTALVVGPSSAQYVGSNWTCASPPAPVCWYLWKWSDFVAAGGLNYVDIVSYVRYLPLNWDCCWVDTMLNTVDANRGGKPTWLIETGFGGSPDDGLSKARDLVRSVVIFWNRGFTERYFWYMFQASETYGGSYNKGFVQTTTGSGSKGIEPDPLFHPVFRASEVMSLVLSGFGTVDHPAAIDVGSGARAYRFTSANREVWVFWNKDMSSSANITLNTGGKTTRVIGLFGEDLGTFAGGTITASPLPTYLTTDLAWNQDVGRITGRVRSGALPNQWNNGVAGAMVMIDGPVVATVSTDLDGNYSFDFLPMGSYTVSVSGFATTPASQVVEVQRDAAWGRTSFVTN